MEQIKIRGRRTAEPKKEMKKFSRNFFFSGKVNRRTPQAKLSHKFLLCTLFHEVLSGNLLFRPIQRQKVLLQPQQIGGFLLGNLCEIAFLKN